MIKAIIEPVIKATNALIRFSFIVFLFINPTKIPINNNDGRIIVESPVNNEQAIIIKIVKANGFPLKISLKLILSTTNKENKTCKKCLQVYSSGVPSIAPILAGKYSSTIYSKPYLEKDCCSAFLPSLSIFLISVCQNFPL